MHLYQESHRASPATPAPALQRDYTVLPLVLKPSVILERLQLIAKRKKSLRKEEKSLYKE